MAGFDVAAVLAWAVPPALGRSACEGEAIPMQQQIVAGLVAAAGTAFNLWLQKQTVPDWLLVSSWVACVGLAGLIAWWPRWKAAWSAFWHVGTVPMRPASEQIYKRTYRNEVVDIDGKTFSECTFENATLRFNGTGYADFINMHPLGTNQITTTCPQATFFNGLVENLRIAPFVEHVDVGSVMPDGEFKRTSRTLKAPGQLSNDSGKNSDNHG